MADESSGASAIVIIDLNKADAELAAKELVEWFGQSSLVISFIRFLRALVYRT